jgi:hypothetical protein
MASRAEVFRVGERVDAAAIGSSVLFRVVNTLVR